MTAMLDHLQRRIALSGPMTLADYMADCLLHPTLGYYTTRDPLGTQGDFTTAPEISQMFGELIGLSLAQCWLDQGAPSAFVLAEAGPGRGTLMADILRATAAVPGFHAALRLHLIEASPALQEKQREALAGFEVTWQSELSALPEHPLFFVANEFFDALPIRQFVRDGQEWRERRVQMQEDALGFALGGAAPEQALAHRLEDTKDGDLVEICPIGQTIAAEVGRRIETHGGAALIIDYGDWRSQGDTLQALKAHRYIDPFDAPGDSDLTAHVDFEALASAAPCAHSKLVGQGVFLERLGITQRAQALAARKSDQALQDVIDAHRRLTHPTEMGTLFKVLGLFPSTQTPPPGLDT
ncbi:MAG: SAM-dependent methyltransferase [Thalassovita sp.]